MLQGSETEGIRSTRRKASRTMSLADFVREHWLPWAERKQKSWRVSWRIARTFILPFFGANSPGTLTFRLVRQWQKELNQQGLAPSTFNRVLSVFKTICNLGESQGWLDREFSPAQALDWARVEKPARRILALVDMRSLLDRLESSSRQEAVAVLLLLYCGASKNAVLKARWQDVDLSGAILRTRAGRGSSQVLLPAEAVELLRRQSQSGSFIFTGKDGRRPLADTYRFWEELRNSLGLHGLLIKDAQASYSHWRLRVGPEALLKSADDRAERFAP